MNIQDFIIKSYSGKAGFNQELEAFEEPLQFKNRIFSNDILLDKLPLSPPHLVSGGKLITAITHTYVTSEGTPTDASILEGGSGVLKSILREPIRRVGHESLSHVFKSNNTCVACPEYGIVLEDSMGIIDPSLYRFLSGYIVFNTEVTSSITASFYAYTGRMGCEGLPFMQSLSPVPNTVLVLRSIDGVAHIVQEKVNLDVVLNNTDELKEGNTNLFCTPERTRQYVLPLLDEKINNQTRHISDSITESVLAITDPINSKLCSTGDMVEQTREYVDLIKAGMSKINESHNYLEQEYSTNIIHLTESERDVKQQLHITGKRIDELESSVHDDVKYSQELSHQFTIRNKEHEDNILSLGEKLTALSSHVDTTSDTVHDIMDCVQQKIARSTVEHTILSLESIKSFEAFSTFNTDALDHLELKCASDIDSIHREISGVSDELGRVYDETSHIHEKLESLSRGANRTSDEMVRMSDELGRVSEGLGYASGEMTSISDKHTRLDFSIVEINKEIEQVSSEVVKIHCSLNDITHSNNDTVVEIKSFIGELRDEITTTQKSSTETIKNMTMMVDDVVSQVEHVTKQYDCKLSHTESNILDKISAVSQYTDTMMQDLHVRIDAVRSYTDEHTDKHKDNTNLEAHVDELSERLHVSDKTLHETTLSVNDTILVINNDITSINDTLESVDNQLLGVESRLISRANELDDKLSSGLEHLASEIHAVCLSTSMQFDMENDAKIKNVESILTSLVDNTQYNLQSHVMSVINSLNTDSIPEGEINKYMNLDYIKSIIPTENEMDARIASHMRTVCSDDIREGNNLYFSEDRVRRVINTTDDLHEGKNLYFTTERAEQVAMKVADETLHAMKTEIDLNLDEIRKRHITATDIYNTLNIKENSILTEIPNNVVTDEIFNERFSPKFFDVLNTISTINIREDPQRRYFSEGLLIQYIEKLTTKSIREEGDLKYFNLESFLDAKINTDHVIEGTSNLYYSEARVDTRISEKLNAVSTDDILEGSSNLFFNESKVKELIDHTANRIDDNLLSMASCIHNLTESIEALDSSKVREHSNLYFTADRAIDATRDHIRQSSEVTLELAASMISNLELKVNNELDLLKFTHQDIIHIDNLLSTNTHALTVVESTVASVNSCIAELKNNVHQLEASVENLRDGSSTNISLDTLEQSVRSVGGDMFPDIVCTILEDITPNIKSDLYTSLYASLSETLHTDLYSECERSNRTFMLHIDEVLRDATLSVGHCIETKVTTRLSHLSESIRYDIDIISDNQLSLGGIVTNVVHDISKLKDDTRRTTDDILEVKQEVEKVTDDVIEIKQEVEKVTDDVIEIKQEVEKVTGGVIEIKQEVEKVTGGVIEIKQEVEKVTDDVIEVKQEVGKVTVDVQKVEGSITSAFSELHEMSSNISGLSNVIKNVELSLNSYINSASTELLNDISIVKSYINDGLEDIRSEIHTVDVRIDELACTTLTTENIMESKNLYFTKERALDAVSNELDNLRTLISTQKHTNDKPSLTLDDIGDGEHRKIINQNDILELIYKHIDDELIRKIEPQIHTKDDIVNNIFESITSSDIKEGANLFFTESRVLNIISEWQAGFRKDIEYHIKSTLNTSNISEHESRLFFTNERVISSGITLDSVADGVVRRIPSTTSHIQESEDALYYTHERVLDVITPILNTLKVELSLRFDTSFITEGSQLFYKDERVDSRIEYVTAPKLVEIENTISEMNIEAEDTREKMFNMHSELVSQLGNITTDSVPEGMSNLYYTNMRFTNAFWDNINTVSTLNIKEDPQRRYLSTESIKSILKSLDTSNLPESSVNRYLTEENFRSLNISSDSIIQGANNIYYRDSYVDARVQDIRDTIVDLYDNISEIKSAAILLPDAVRNLGVTSGVCDGYYVYTVEFEHSMNCTICISFDDHTVTANVSKYVHISSIEVKNIHVFSVNSVGRSLTVSATPSILTVQLYGAEYDNGYVVADHDVVPLGCDLVIGSNGTNLVRVRCTGGRTNIPVNFTEKRLRLQIIKGSNVISNDLVIDISSIELNFPGTNYIRLTGCDLLTDNHKIFDGLILTARGEDNTLLDCNTYYSIRNRSSSGNVISVTYSDNFYLLELDKYINRITISSVSNNTIFFYHGLN